MTIDFRNNVSMRNYYSRIAVTPTAFASWWNQSANPATKLSPHRLINEGTILRQKKGGTLGFQAKKGDEALMTIGYKEVHREMPGSSLPLPFYPREWPRGWPN